MTDDRIDFSPLDPTLPADQFERRVAQLRFAASAVMARRRAGLTPFSQLSQWRAPLLAALLLITFASVALLRTVRLDTGFDAEPATDEIAEALGTNSTMGALLLSTSTSPVDALLSEGVPQ